MMSDKNAIRYILSYLAYAIGKAVLHPFKKVYTLFMHKKVATNKKKFEKGLDGFDPFAEIARNGLETSIYVDSGGNHTKRFSIAALARIGNAYIEQGKKPIFLYIAQETGYINHTGTEFGFSVVNCRLSNEKNILDQLLSISAAAESQKSVIIDLCYTHKNWTKNISVEDQVSEVLSYLLAHISSVQNHVLLIVMPFRSLYPEIPKTIEDAKKLHQSLETQYINLENYEFLGNTDQYADNMILFPMHHYKKNIRGLEETYKAFPNVDPKRIRMKFWDYHQAIYKIDTNEGYCFMKNHEIHSDNED